MWWFLGAGVTCLYYCHVPVDIVWNYKFFFTGEKIKLKKENNFSIRSHFSIFIYCGSVKKKQFMLSFQCGPVLAFFFLSLLKSEKFKNAAESVDENLTAHNASRSQWLLIKKT